MGIVVLALEVRLAAEFWWFEDAQGWTFVSIGATVLTVGVFLFLGLFARPPAA